MLSALGSRAIIGEFYNRLSQEEGIPWVGGTSMFFESDQASEIYEQIGQVPTMQEWVSGRTAKMLELLGKITIINKHYESTLTVLKTEIRRDKTGQVQVRLNDQVRRAQAHWALLLTDLMKTGQTVAGQDGQFFFDTDHKEGNNQTNQNNDLTTNISVAANPTAVEMETAIFNMIATIIGFLDNENQPMNEDATDFTVMVRQNMMAAATAAIKGTMITDSSGSKTNVLATLGNFKIDLAVNPRLSATDEFYVFRTDGNGTKAFIRQEETPLTIEALAEGSDEAFKNKRHLYGIDSWRNVGFGMWQHACLQTFT